MVWCTGGVSRQASRTALDRIMLPPAYAMTPERPCGVECAVESVNRVEENGWS